MAEKLPTWPWSAFRAPTARPDAHSEAPHIDSAAPGTNSRAEQYKRLRQKLPGTPDLLGYAPQGDPTLRLRGVAAGASDENATRDRHPALATHGPPHPVVPEFNVWYDQYATRDAYDKMILNTAHGSLVPVVGAPGVVSGAVTLDVPARLRLSEFPGGTQAFPVLLLFTYSQSAAATSGQYSVSFTPNGGDFAFPLGEYNATLLSVFNTQRWILPAQVTDPGVLALGTLTVTSTGLVAPPTLTWRMGIGWAYILRAPAFKPALPIRAGSRSDVAAGGGSIGDTQRKDA